MTKITFSYKTQRSMNSTICALIMKITSAQQVSHCTVHCSKMWMNSENKLRTKTIISTMRWSKFDCKGLIAHTQTIGVVDRNQQALIFFLSFNTKMAKWKWA